MSFPFTFPTSFPGTASARVNLSSDTGGLDGSLWELTSHCASARSLILSQYSESPRLLALLCSYVTRVQELEKGIVGLYQWGWDIDNSEGSQLDLIGRIVRESRDGREDEEYRASLRVRVLINRSQGRLEDLIKIASLYESGAPVRVREYARARVVVWMGAPAMHSPQSLHVRLLRAKAAGVALQTVTNPAATTGRIFLWGRAPDKTNITTGFGWTGDGRGGALAHVLG